MTPAGWYGKLPALGDFASRRLSPGFVEIWDAWLQRGLAASQSELGADWLERYLTSLVWHFVLHPGVVGNEAWAGIVMSSVDRVGRYFPLTICAAIDAPGDSVGWDKLESWLDALEVAARSVLDVDAELDTFEGTLTGLPLPDLGASVATDAQHFSESLIAGTERTTLPPIRAVGVQPMVETLAFSLNSVAMRGMSLWWCRDTADGLGGFVHRGLPQPALFTNMYSYSPANT